jgi:hypothetical protein
MVYQRSLVQHIVLPEQYALTYYRQPHNNLLMPIIRKTRLSNNMQTNLGGKIRELFVVYYSTHVIRFSSKSHIQNQHTVIAWNINNNYEQRNINNITLLLPLGHIPISSISSAASVSAYTCLPCRCRAAGPLNSAPPQPNAAKRNSSEEILPRAAWEKSLAREVTTDGEPRTRQRGQHRGKPTMAYQSGEEGTRLTSANSIRSILSRLPSPTRAGRGRQVRVQRGPVEPARLNQSCWRAKPTSRQTYRIWPVR